ncbi:MAG: sulfurtransferase complex subunit TusB [Thermoplasmata archaeon]
MKLHVISRPEKDLEAAVRAGAVCAIFIEDGVLCALRGSPSEPLVRQLLAGGAELYALKDDLLARGLLERVVEGIHAVGYDGFVELVERNEIVSWR